MKNEVANHAKSPLVHNNRYSANLNICVSVSLNVTGWTTSCRTQTIK